MVYTCGFHHDFHLIAHAFHEFDQSLQLRVYMSYLHRPCNYLAEWPHQTDCAFSFRNIDSNAYHNEPP